MAEIVESTGLRPIDVAEPSRAQRLDDEVLLVIDERGRVRTARPRLRRRWQHEAALVALAAMTVRARVHTEG
ncbi:MAG: hypothetical protein ACRD0M_11265, partial [Acidimicrobiales bacterium]